MAHLILKLLGTYRLKLDGHAIGNIESDQARALLAYLAVENNQAHPREKLLGIIWPETDEQHARNSLSQAISHLRLILGDRSTAGNLISEELSHSKEPYLLVSPHEIQVNPHSDFETDVGLFSALVESCKAHAHPTHEICEACLERYQAADKLYTGDFLGGFFLPKSIVFEEWATIQRERLRLEIMAVLEHLVKAFERRGEPDRALFYARRMAALDGYSEAGNLHVMRLLALMDNRKAALEQYDTFQNRLAVELGAEPSTEALQLFNRLRSENAGIFPGNLPASLPPLIGREQELDQLWVYLRDPQSRLICILGMGGCGKTHLAIEAACRQRYYFIDGAYFIPLSASGAGSSLLAILAEGLGFSFRETGNPKRQLLDYLRNKKIVLILDSFETVVESAGFVAELLAASEGIKVLVTSRVRLNLSREQIFPLNGMRVPPPNQVEKALDYGSVRLFLEAARRVKPDYNPDQLEGVVRICRLVDGIPLSLLLASTWMSDYSEDEIANQIERSLDFLAAEWADLPERQRSLRATFEYSWNMLSIVEQSVLMKLAVFRNPFSIQAAHQVAGSNRQILHTLVEKSVLISPYEGHYLMHDMVRQFSLEKLAGHPEAIEANIRQRHSDYFLEWASTWGRIFKSSEQKTLLENVDKVFEDVKMAWDWATQQEELIKIGEASEGLFLYYFLRYRYQEGERTCTAALDRIRVAPANSERLGLEGWILAWQACFHRLLGNIDPARLLLEKSLETLLQAQANGQDTRLGQALVWREKSWLANNLQETQDYLMRSSALYQELGESWRNGEVHAFMGEVANRLGKRVLALEILQQAVAMSQLAGEPRLLARSLTSLAYAHMIFWEWEKGFTFMEKAASAYRSAGDAGSLSQAEAITGTSLTLAGRYPEAEVILDAALQKLQQLGDRFYTAHITLYLGVCQGQRGQFTQAILTLQKALELARQDGYKREEMQCLAHLGGLALLQGDAKRALELLQPSVDGFRQMKFSGELAMALGGLALAQHRLGEEKPALASLGEALRLAAASHNRLSLLLIPSAIVGILANAKKWEQAVEAYAGLMTDPLVANSRFFAALVGNRIELAREQLSEEAWLAAETGEQVGDLFEKLGRLAQEIES